MKSHSFRIISIFLLISLLGCFSILSLSTINASAYERVIRVAEINLPNFYNYDSQGPSGGYGYEYLEEISHYTGWRFEHVPVTWERGLKMLEAGEIDLLVPAPSTPELQKQFDFTEKEVGLNYSVLCVAADDTETAANDFYTINGMKVGLIKGSSINDSLQPFADVNDILIQSVTFDTRVSMYKAFLDGSIDAILTSSLDRRPSERIIARFAPVPYYFITAKGNDEIMDPLNAAITSIKGNNPYFDYELQKKYYGQAESTVPIFTKEEKEFIRKSGPLKTVYDPVWSPIEYYDEETGRFSGINADIFDLISDMSGLKFSYIKNNSYSDALKMIENHKAAILTGIDNDTVWADKHNLILTESYLSASIVLVKNKNVQDLETATVALAKDYLASEYIIKADPNIRTIYFDSPLKCFEAVNRGLADITYANSYVAERLLENPKLNRLSVVETVNLSDELCIGISDAEDPLLVSILNKSINCISDAHLNRIIFHHTISEKPEINLEYLFYKEPRYFMAALLALFLGTTIILAAIIITKNIHNREIRKIAYLDSVTGISNYNKFKVDAQALLKNAKNKSYAVVYLDIHKFSYINDTFGYSAGDAILSAVARELQLDMKDSECSARISADNFVCLLEYEGDDSIRKRGIDIQKRFDERLSKINSRFKVHLTSAIYRISRGETDIPSIVGKADIAHKTIGDIHKSAIIFYDDKIQSEFLRKKKLESAMASSLENKDFIVHLQPKIDLSNNTIVGTEALARWQHPTEGLIMPNQFISLFESNGFIMELDFYIYEEVCRLLRKWLDAGETVLPVSVNVSRAHLADPKFSSRLNALIDRYRINPEFLELELTEDILINDAQEAVSMIRDLKNLGFSILIDDFGSGYSSLNLLKDLAVDVLKLDKEFFRKGGMTEKDKIIVEGIIRIAKELALKILAEGVETQEQVDFLTDSGCHMAQGYFFARPMPVEDFEKLIGYTG